jgi:hypothetical protein
LTGFEGLANFHHHVGLFSKDPCYAILHGSFPISHLAQQYIKVLDMFLSNKGSNRFFAEWIVFAFSILVLGEDMELAVYLRGKNAPAPSDF